MLGTTISHYHITGKFGAGGMGEVYRATDSKLDRDVAIKVMPEEFSENAERVALFEREAKSLVYPKLDGSICWRCWSMALGSRPVSLFCCIAFTFSVIARNWASISMSFAPVPGAAESD